MPSFLSRLRGGRFRQEDWRFSLSHTKTSADAYVFYKNQKNSEILRFQTTLARPGNRYGIAAMAEAVGSVVRQPLSVGQGDRTFYGWVPRLDPGKDIERPGGGSEEGLLRPAAILTRRTATHFYIPPWVAVRGIPIVKQRSIHPSCRQRRGKGRCRAAVRAPQRR